ncbi:hypothetical protein MMC16_000730 [Acarospora aff. strigata]|nr:hypothetical protein [Acarospora aff. strigata]
MTLITYSPQEEIAYWKAVRAVQQNRQLSVSTAYHTESIYSTDENGDRISQKDLRVEDEEKAVRPHVRFVDPVRDPSAAEPEVFWPDLCGRVPTASARRRYRFKAWWRRLRSSLSCFRE